MIPITITITPTQESAGHFDASVGDLHLCRSRQPFCDGARALLELGYPADTIVAMKSADSNTERLRSTVDAAGGLTVEECTDGRPRFRKFRPRPSEGSPPIARRENSDPVIVGAIQ